MADLPSPPALLPVKLEIVLVAWLLAKRGELLPGVTIFGAHAPGEPPAVPWLSVYCSGDHTHPDFAEVNGTGWPKLATVYFTLRIHKALDFYETASRWAAEIQGLLTGDDSTLLADLNAGGDFHPAGGLHVFGLAEAEDSLTYQSAARLVTFGIEFTAQTGDPET